MSGELFFSIWYTLCMVFIGGSVHFSMKKQLDSVAEKEGQDRGTIA
ncbi:MAG: hypothetical protein ACOYI2_01795 [Bacillota bacterium]|jgi:hypothetical protein